MLVSREIHVFYRIWFLGLTIFRNLAQISIIIFSGMRNEVAASETRCAVENVGGAASLSYALFTKS